MSVKTQYVSGVVQKFFTSGEDQLVLMQRKTKDSKFVCRFKDGEHRSLIEGEDKKFDGMVKSDNPYRDYDTYDFVGVQATTSNRVYAPADPQSDVTEVVPSEFPTWEAFDQSIHIASQAAWLVQQQIPDLFPVDTPEKIRKVMAVAADLHVIARVMMGELKLDEVFKK